MNVKKVLIIGLVWPEPTSSAAGTRMIQLLNMFISAAYEVTFASAASKSAFSFDLPSIGVKELEISLNDNSFNSLLIELQPDVVVFDRFMTEEQYGWRVRQECAEALCILDTEDLHSLRYARQQAVKTGYLTDSADLFTDLAKRELASIWRCDLTLMISEVEIEILKTRFRVDPNLIYYLPFLEEKIADTDILNWKGFEEREGFVFIGNFLHEPNWNTLKVLKTQIWPALRKKLPAAVMHVYGSYASQKVTQLHQPKENFLVHGRTADARYTVGQHKVMLAPIHFGAGVKGKFIDAMHAGTPAVTTTTGAEAMKGDLDWNGMITDDHGLFISYAFELYQNRELWIQSQQNGVRILNERYDKSKYIASFLEKLLALSADLSKHRQHNFFGQVLQYHTANSTKYMSLWIEEKNKNKQP